MVFNNQPNEVSTLLYIEGGPENVDMGELIELGLMIQTTVRKTNKTFREFIATSYVCSVISLTLSMFVVVANLTLNEEQNLDFITGIFFCECLVCLVRLYYLMSSGEFLANKIKQSKRVLEEVGIFQEISSENCKHQTYYKTYYVLQQRLNIDHPIAPFSIFTTNNKTFVVTITTIITYIVILIKLRGTETSLPYDGNNKINTTMA